VRIPIQKWIILRNFTLGVQVTSAIFTIHNGFRLKAINLMGLSAGAKAAKSGLKFTVVQKEVCINYADAATIDKDAFKGNGIVYNN
jgi:hypothetical protein